MKLDPEVTLDPIDSIHSFEHAQPIGVTHDQQLKLYLVIWHLCRLLQVQSSSVVARLQPQSTIAVLAVLWQVHHVTLTPLRWQAIIPAQYREVVCLVQLSF